MSNQPKYTYSRRFSWWSVYRMTYFPEGGSSGDKVASFPTKEEARKECYRLNGWKWKEEKK